MRAQSSTIPAPVGGWNARDPLDDMDSIYAPRMVNYFPQMSDIQLRKGYRVHATGMGSGAVQTLMEYAGKDGSRKLLACANGNIYNASTYNAAATSLASGFASNRWQFINYKNTLIAVNGLDTPQQFNGTSFSAATYTGPADPKELVSVHVYKERLYFVEENSQSFWYSHTAGSITGALDEYNVGTFLKLGGYLLFAGSQSRETGAGSQDLFVVCSNMGEVLVYSGSYPGDANWGLIGRYYLPSFLGRRAFFNKDADMALISQQGIIPLNRVLDANGLPSEKETLSSNIQNAFREAARLYSSNQGWSGLNYPRGNMAIINIPVSQDTNAEQYVVNTLTGAWARFTGIPAVSWSLFNDKPYFGGPDGKVYEFDVNSSDNGAAIRTQLKWAFNYFKDRSRIKRFLMARPLIISDSPLSFVVGIDVDFQDQQFSATTSTSGASGSAWDVAEWDTYAWDNSNLYSANWNQLSAVGRCGALRMEGDFLNVSFSLSAVNITYEPGGFL